MNNIFITAEIGINHNGDIEIAKQLINMAIRCGCDAVKFQKRTIDKVYTQEFLDSPRQSPWGTTQREQKNALELTEEEYHQIDEYCKKQGIAWYASAWDVESQMFLRKYDLKYNKIASKMITDEALIKMVAEEKKLTFISTGLRDESAVLNAVNIFQEFKCPFILMHCAMKYPCSLDDCKLSAIPDIVNTYGRAGYSSHFPGASLDTIVAVTLGATALEKHITLDRSMYGTDQSASLEERGLYLMVRDAKAVGRML